MRAFAGLAVSLATSVAIPLAAGEASADSSFAVTPLARSSLGSRLAVNDDPLVDLGFTYDQTFGVALAYMKESPGFGVNTGGRPEFDLAPNLGMSLGQGIKAFQIGIGVGGGVGWIGATYEPKLIAGTWDREDDDLDEVPLVGMRNSVDLNLFFGAASVEVGHEVDYYVHDFHDSVVAFFRLDVGVFLPLVITGLMSNSS
ncbi:MAG: hypothetical protein U0271_37735 [Polyangiaceae bacterium]